MPKTLPIWVYPTLFLIFGFASGFVLSRIDVGEDSSLAFLAYGGDAQAARTLAASVLSGVVSITTLTLTVTIVTLQLASSQYSPRLMKRYLEDRAIQLTVSLFLFAFAFTLPVLFHIRGGEDGAAFVPGLALSLVVFLAMVVLAGLVYFVFHVTNSVRVENILDRIAIETLDVLERTPQLRADGAEREPLDPDAEWVPAFSSGFLVSVDADRLAAELPAGQTVWFDIGIGDYVASDTTVAWTTGPESAHRVAEVLDAAMQVGAERDDGREFAFGLRQVFDIGLKALSPGINDPTTAILSVGVATGMLAGAASAEPVPEQLDIEGPTVHLPRPAWGELVAASFDQYATYGSTDAQFIRALTRALKRLAAVAPSTASREVLHSVADHLTGVVNASPITGAAASGILADLRSTRERLAATDGGTPADFSMSPRVV